MDTTVASQADAKKNSFYKTSKSEWCVNERSLSMASQLDSSLKKDQAFQKDKLQHLLWFHPSISRTAAETKIHKYGSKKNGVFLVREHDGEFRLSFSFDKKIAHFKITEVSSLHYRIEDGPIKKGLDELLTFYCHNCSNLPCQLVKYVKGELPPPLALSKGYTNLLHKALTSEDVEQAKKILAHKRCPNVDMKNDKGYTALHITASKGLRDLIPKLFEKNATVNTLDSEGFTPLHRAAMNNKPRVVQLLIEDGGADFQYRHFDSGNVPLHEAAMRGNIECVQELLKHGAVAWPNNNNGVTPYELAKQHAHHKCTKYIDDYNPPTTKTFKEDWCHQNIDRRGALALLEKNGIKDGLFLVRNSSHHKGSYVLTFSLKGKGHHFEIKSKQNHAFYLESGPLFTSLEHLVEFYCLHQDGLDCKLNLAIKPDGSVKPMLLTQQMEEFYYLQNMTATVTEEGFTEYSLASHITRNNSASSINQLSRHGSTTSAGSSDYQIPAPPSAKALFNRKLEGYILKQDSVETAYELGQGEFGSVLKGTWKSPNGVVDVAIKTLHEEYVATEKTSFLKEAEIMVKLQHPCIVSLIGVCEGPPPMLIQELVNLGSLLDFLLDHPEKIDPVYDLNLWAAQISSGMLYLEKERFVHRDLAARNILVQSKSQVKVGDFGLSRAVGTEENYYKASKGGRWPVRWYAPESINYGQFSHASDVWSYGVTLWEMFTFGDQPYEDKTGAEVAVFLEKGGRLAQPKDCPTSVYEIMKKCWEYLAEKRLTFDYALNYFNNANNQSCC